MTPELHKPQYAQEQLADLTKTLKKEKLQLTPEIEEYTRNHIRAVQDKLQAGQDVHERDLEFIENVKLWIFMPEGLREKYSNIDEIRKDGDIMSGRSEAKKRHISLKKWFLLLYMAKTAGEGREWIDAHFTFSDKGEIKANTK